MAERQGGSNGTYDVVIAGGGPGGSTAATLLRKYDPRLKVLVVERERFPREHIGESQLPAIMPVLHEMGAWDKVEAAGFPVKLGASLTWGRDNESWDFDFFPVEDFKDQARPAKYEGQRLFTAFQVDRAIYDDILLKHAAEAGAEVRQGTKVEEVGIEGDRITGLRLSDGTSVEGRHYIDASGTWAVLRRALGIRVDYPVELRNIALWDYWTNAEWAVRIGVGGTRIQVRSLPYGWIWFIPLGPTRTSIGLVCPVEHYQKAGQKRDDLYYDSIRNQPQVGPLVKSATPEGRVRSTKDWSNLAERLTGDNWVLVGESAGFADPILSAGMTLAHTSARDAAYTILEMDRGDLDRAWLRKRYDTKNRANIRQHIRFAQYWYATNKCLTDLQGECARIAKEAGIKLAPQQAWGWLAQGGFSNSDPGLPLAGSFDRASARVLVGRFLGGECRFAFEKVNVLKLNLVGATKTWLGTLEGGRIRKAECYERAGRSLGMTGTYGDLVRLLRLTSDAETLFNTLRSSIASQYPGEMHERVLSLYMQALDTMIDEGWIKGSHDPKRPLVQLAAGGGGGRNIRASAEADAKLREAQAGRGRNASA